MASVGDRIRILSDGADFAPVREGDEYTVLHVSSTGSALIAGEWLIGSENFEIIDRPERGTKMNPTFAVGDLISYEGHDGKITYGPLAGPEAQYANYIIAVDHSDYELVRPASALKPRAEFEPGQTALWADVVEVTILSGPHEDGYGTRRYAVQSVDGALSFAVAKDLAARS